MINLVLSIKLSPDKNTEFNQSLELIFRELVNREGLLFKKMSVSDIGADIVLTWNSNYDLDTFIRSESYRFLLGAVTVLGDSHTIKREEVEP